MDRKWFLKLIGMGTVGSLSPQMIPSHAATKITRPKKLQKGDTIGLISPGMILPDRDQYDDIIAKIMGLGYNFKVGANARNRYGYLAGKDKERAADLNAMFADDTVDAILPFRGGWGCNRILHLIDYPLIKDNPKLLVGFSDITTLLLAIYAKTGLVTFHGPVGKSDWTEFTTQHFLDAISYDDSYTLIPPKNDFCDDCREVQTIRPGHTEGRLLGGNLSVLAAMMGSSYLPKWEDNILFLEDVGEDVYRIDRMLTQLKLNGVLDKISGFVFGQCNSCDRSNSYSLTMGQVFDDHIKPLGIPAFSGAMFGHIKDMVTLPVGVKAAIDADAGSISLVEPATS